MTSRAGQGQPRTSLGLWLAAPPVRIPGAGRVSWKEIKQVPKPAWQAVKILPGFCQFCRKCHTPPSIQAEINRKCFSFPVNIFEISEAFLIPSLKCKRENWDGLKKNWDRSIKSFVSKTYLFFSQYKQFTDTISSPPNTSVLKT